MTKTIIIPPDGDIRVVYYDDFQDLQRLVGGPIKGLQVSDTIFAYINEEGKLTVPPLPPNPYATMLCMVKRTGLHELDTIVGPMVCIGPIGPEGEDLDILDKDAEYILTHIK